MSNLLSFGDVNGLHAGIAGRLDRILHLHRFYDEKDVADLYSITGKYLYLRDYPRKRGAKL